MNPWSSTFRASLIGGPAAGVVAAAFTVVVVEPTIRVALAVEESRGSMEHSGHDAELVSRGVQQIGGAVAVVVAALLLSMLYAVALSRVRQSSKLSELESALVVAGVGFAIFALAPGLKYPANPPAVGDPDTVNERTLLYGCSIAIAALTAIALLTVVRTGRRRGWSSTRVTWSVVGVLAVGLTILFVGLPPSPDAIPSDVAAGLVWQFRIKSLGTLALLWTTLGLVTGTILTRKAAVTAYDRTHQVLSGR